MANAIRKGFMPSAMHLQDIAMHPQDICRASAKCLPCICKIMPEPIKALIVTNLKKGQSFGANMAIQLSEHFTYQKLLRFTFPSIIMLVFTFMA